jgi:excisionase family DNA binding protein
MIFENIQTVAIAKALKLAIPTTDPDENVYMTIKEAAHLLGLSKQTIQSKKKKMLLEFYGQGRITRTTLAAIKRYLKKFGVPLSRLGRPFN